jgi:hypothetical protein
MGLLWTFDGRGSRFHPIRRLHYHAWSIHLLHRSDRYCIIRALLLVIAVFKLTLTSALIFGSWSLFTLASHQRWLHRFHSQYALSVHLSITCDCVYKHRKFERSFLSKQLKHTAHSSDDEEVLSHRAFREHSRMETTHRTKEIFIWYHELISESPIGAYMFCPVRWSSTTRNRRCSAYGQHLSNAGPRPAQQSRAIIQSCRVSLLEAMNKCPTNRDVLLS